MGWEAKYYQDDKRNNNLDDKEIIIWITKEIIIWRTKEIIICMTKSFASFMSGSNNRNLPCGLPATLIVTAFHLLLFIDHILFIDQMTTFKSIKRFLKTFLFILKTSEFETQIALWQNRLHFNFNDSPLAAQLKVSYYKPLDHAEVNEYWMWQRVNNQPQTN